jgi:hypothetical protein
MDVERTAHTDVIRSTVHWAGGGTMKRENIDYVVSGKPLVRPFGDYHYVAKLLWMKQRTSDGVKDVHPQVTEHYGVTKAEAEATAEAEVRAWLYEHCDKAST